MSDKCEHLERQWNCPHCLQSALSELAAPTGSASLAAKIARDIFKCGDGCTPCQRIAFKGGTYAYHEEDNGGLCETALIELIMNSLNTHLPRRIPDSERGL